jgi:hypothetical protein
MVMDYGENDIVKENLNDHDSFIYVLILCLELSERGVVAMANVEVESSQLVTVDYM